MNPALTCGTRCTYAEMAPMDVHRVHDQVRGMATPEKEFKDQRLSMRISRRQREVIAQAAEAAETDVSAFVLDAALVSAQRVLADQRFFSVSGEAWDRFVEILDRPVTPLSAKPRLEGLLTKPSVLEQ